jgi:tetratricopeptide (TPR) repeat protein
MWIELSTVVLMTLLSASEPPKGDQAWVLSPSSEGHVASCLQVGTPHPGGGQFSAAIEATSVEVKLSRAGAVPFHISLIHPSLAPKGATIHAGVAIVVKQLGGAESAPYYQEAVRRLKSCVRPIPWTALASEPAPEPKGERGPSGVGIDELYSELDRIHNRIGVGHSEEAVAILKELPKELTDEASIEVALAWRLAGEPARAKALLSGLTELRPPLDSYALVVGGEQERVAKKIAEAKKDSACELAHVAELKARLGDHVGAIETAARIRTLDPACARAWELEVSERALHGDPARALDVGDEAVRIHEQDAGLLSAVAAARLQSGRVDEAITLLERVARRAPRPRGVLRVLLGAMVRQPERRTRTRARLEARLNSGEDDQIDRFLLGVVRHYENEFAASNELLIPLEEELGEEDRLQIYRAMNDFNLGDRPGAMARLEKTAKRSDPDPDIYYCLAELLRDEDRPRALESLRRYASASQHDPMSNPSKEARIRRLVSGLEACIEDGRASCEGEWEHPRLRFATEEDDQRRRVWYIAAAVIVFFGIVAIVRRRRSAAP